MTTSTGEDFKGQIKFNEICDHNSLEVVRDYLLSEGDCEDEEINGQAEIPVGRDMLAGEFIRAKMLSLGDGSV